jgi:hypothetical protein
LPSCSLSVSQNNKSTETGCPETSRWRTDNYTTQLEYIPGSRLQLLVHHRGSCPRYLKAMPLSRTGEWAMMWRQEPTKTFRKPVRKFRYDIHMNLRRQVVRMW